MGDSQEIEDRFLRRQLCIHVYTSRFSAGVPAPLVAQSAGLLPVSSFVTPGGLPKSLWPGVCAYSRGETHRAGRCGRIKDRKSARCHCLLLTSLTTREAPAPPVLTLPCYCQWDRRALVHVAGVGGCTPGEGDTSDATEAGDDLKTFNPPSPARKNLKGRAVTDTSFLGKGITVLFRANSAASTESVHGPPPTLKYKVHLR